MSTATLPETAPVYDPTQLTWQERVKAVARACSRIGATRVWAIGSAARGTVDSSSDLDIVVERAADGRPCDRVGAVLDALDRYFELDILVYKPDELRGLLASGHPFLSNAWPDARLIWSAQSGIANLEWASRLDLQAVDLTARRNAETAAIHLEVGFRPAEGGLMFDPIATSRDWMEQTEADLSAARLLRSGGQYALACFHCQQAAEKAIKAFLVRTGDRSVPEPDVSALVVRAQTRDRRFGRLIPDGAFLERFYLPTRYPDAWAAGGVPARRYFDPDAQQTLTAAERVIKVVQEVLRELDGPQHP